MTNLTPEQWEAVRAEGWTEEEVVGFAEAMATFRDGLSSRQQDAFNAILAAARATATADDARGYILRAPGQPLTANTFGPPQSNPQVVIAIIAILIG